MTDVRSAHSALELNYTLTSLQQVHPPLRPDGRSTTQHRPIIAETGDAVLPYTYGSARVGFAGGEAIAGVRAEVVRPASLASASLSSVTNVEEMMRGHSVSGDGSAKSGKGYGRLITVVVGGEERREWSGPVEDALGRGRLVSDTWAWKILVDIVILTQPEAHPASLISYALHLALADTKLPKCLSGPQEDPIFADDWALAEPLFGGEQKVTVGGPPLTVIVAALPSQFASSSSGQGGAAAKGVTLFDPSTVELSVASAVLAVTFCKSVSPSSTDSTTILDIRTLDPPGRKIAAVQSSTTSAASSGETAENKTGGGAWQGVTGGISRSLVKNAIREVLKEGSEMIDSLQALVSSS